MSQRGMVIGLVAIVCGWGWLACGQGAGTPVAPGGAAEDGAAAGARNPFGLVDVVDCCGPDVQAFADEVPRFGEPGDANAEPWAGGGDGSDFTSIDGTWAGRWQTEDYEWVVGTAEIRTEKGRVYIHYRDESNYLVEAERRGDLLVGRYISQGGFEETSPWVGRIVSNSRIDGAYLIGRWDFRRGGVRTDAP